MLRQRPPGRFVLAEGVIHVDRSVNWRSSLRTVSFTFASSENFRIPIWNLGWKCIRWDAHSQVNRKIGVRSQDPGKSARSNLRRINNSCVISAYELFARSSLLYRWNIVNFSDCNSPYNRLIWPSETCHICYARQKRFPSLDSRKLIAHWTMGEVGERGGGCDRYDSAAALAHVALTKCKWRHPSNCRQKGSRGQLSEWRLQDRLKPNYPFVSSGRSINPTRVNVREGRRHRERKRERERESIAISHVDPCLN